MINNDLWRSGGRTAEFRMLAGRSEEFNRTQTGVRFCSRIQSRWICRVADELVVGLQRRNHFLSFSNSESKFGWTHPIEFRFAFGRRFEEGNAIPDCHRQIRTNQLSANWTRWIEIWIGIRSSLPISSPHRRLWTNLATLKLSGERKSFEAQNFGEWFAFANFE